MSGGAMVVVGSSAIAAAGAGAAGEARVVARRRRVRRRLMPIAPAPAAHRPVNRRRSWRTRPGAVLEAVGGGAERAVVGLGLAQPETAPLGGVAPRHRWRGGALLAALALGAASPLAALAVLVGLWSAPPRLQRARLAKRQAEIDRDLPLAVELLAIGAHAGLTVPVALAVVAPHVGAALGPGFAQAASAADRGLLLTDALAELADDLGGAVRPVAGVLAAAARDGDPLAPALDRLADGLQRDRQRRAEIAARRLSVQLLLPLVLCVLPAFALLTVVPLLLGSLRSIPR